MKNFVETITTSGSQIVSEIMKETRRFGYELDSMYCIRALSLITELLLSSQTAVPTLYKKEFLACCGYLDIKVELLYASANVYVIKNK